MEHEQVEKAVAQKSVLVYLPVSIGSAAFFFLIASIMGNYSLVARLGGTIWVGLLSLIVSMPLVISRVKKQLQESIQ